MTASGSGLPIVAAAPLAVLDDVTVVYGTAEAARTALDGARLELWAGDRLALVGPSGSGKSTVIHVVAGLQAPTTGTVTWPALGGPPRHQAGSVGVVFQAPSLLPPLDAVENVELPLLIAGVDPVEARTRAAAALDHLGLADLAQRLPEEMSGGQLQRVAVARVLAGSPCLILADEPTGQLDSTNGAHVIELLLAAADHLDAALVVATHDPRVSARLDTLVTLTDGRMTDERAVLTGLPR